VYDPTVPDALRVPEMWLLKITQEETQSIVFALAGTKADLPEEARKVSKEEVEAFCTQYSIDIYFEVSAKDNHMVDELFQEIVETMLTRFSSSNRRNSWSA